MVLSWLESHPSSRCALSPGPGAGDGSLLRTAKTPGVVATMERKPRELHGAMSGEVRLGKGSFPRKRFFSVNLFCDLLWSQALAARVPAATHSSAHIRFPFALLTPTHWEEICKTNGFLTTIPDLNITSATAYKYRRKGERKDVAQN